MGLTRIRAEQISNIDYKQAVRAVTTSNVTLSGGAPVVVDGVTLIQGNRVLVTGQSTASENGIYVIQTLGTGEDGTWIRATDANQTGEIEAGMVVMVTEGTTYADTPWKLVTNGAIVVGTTALTFQQFSTGANVGGTDTNVQYNSSGNLAGSSNFTWSGTELYVNGAANITGNVTGNYFFGNGSQLSGIITSVANINYGTSNVSIDAANANITMSVDGTANVVVVSTDGITVTGNVIGNGIAVTTVANTAPVNPEQGDIWINSDTGSQYIYFTAGGNSQWAEMEADQSFSSGGSEVDLTAVSSNILPTANITYDIGNTTNRFRDIYLANSTIYLGEAQISATGGAIVLPAGTTIGGSAAETPKIANVQITDSSWTVLDDTAISTDGGYFIVNGTGFQSGAGVSVDGTSASSVSFVDSTLLRCQIGAKAANSYTVYVVNPDGGTALKIAGLTYSGTPTWVTASQLANASANVAFTYTLEATGATSYALAAGNTVPTGSTLAGNGVFSGNVAVNTNTNYTFTVVATDAELQDSNRTFNLNVNLVTAPPEVEYLVVAGGGGGGGAQDNSGGAGGGGAGGYRTGNLAVTSSTTYTVTVGAGGSGGTASAGSSTSGTQGENSVFSTITATGGGYGAGFNSGTAGGSGGSGGGGRFGFVTGGAGGAGNSGAYSPSEGNNGGAGKSGTADGIFTGGGGGGAGAEGSGPPNGTGGIGVQSSISGAATYYAGGGGGGSQNGNQGGNGGGGNGGSLNNANSVTAGTTNTGGGGGGGSNNDSGGVAGKAGGSGIVIIRYPDTYNAAASTTGSPEVTTAGGYRIYKFTGSGSITW